MTPPPPPPAAPAERARPLAARLWAYQRERFPLAAYLPLIAVSSLAAAGWSARARGAAGVPRWDVLAAAGVTALVLFFLLRVADEHKDADVDRHARPELPVPRGLVTLGELRGAGAVALAVAVALNAVTAPRLLALAVPVLLWMGLMTKEFFARDWLRGRPGLYLVSHMVVMPLLFLYLTGADWRAAGDGPPPRIALFLLLSFCNGVVIEVGRKIRRPDEEREGVETYTKTWGRRGALAAWLGAMGLAAAALVAADPAMPLAVAALVGALPVGIAALILSPKGREMRGKAFDGLSAAWVLASYVAAGVVPFVEMAL